MKDLLAKFPRPRGSVCLHTSVDNSSAYSKPAISYMPLISRIIVMRWMVAVAFSGIWVRKRLVCSIPEAVREGGGFTVWPST